VVPSDNDPGRLGCRRFPVLRGSAPGHEDEREHFVSRLPRPPSIEPAGIFDGIRPGAVLLGVVVDTVATIVSGLLLFAFTVQVVSQHEGDVPEETLDAMVTSPTFLLASLVIGLLCTTLGAFVGARRAACFHLRHGAWIGVGSAVVSLVSYATSTQGEPNPFWFDMMAFALIIPAGVAGGLLARQWPSARVA
jgi:hypothetical protein